MRKNTYTILTVFFLLVIAGSSYLPFVYKNTFGESDCYLMATGFLESLSSGKRFESSLLLYANKVSFGYYAFLYLFEDSLKEDGSLLFLLMNYTNAVCSILMVIPFFYVIRRYWGFTAAVIANLLLVFIPLWWQLSRYGHPQIPAVFFMFIGLALLGYRSHLKSLKSTAGILFTCDIFVVTTLIISLTMRMDAILMFPLILGCLLLEGCSFRSALINFSLYSVFSVVIYYLLIYRVPDQYVVGSLFAEFHNIARAIREFKHANILFLRAYPPFLLMTFFISCISLLYYRKYTALLFVVPVVLINYIFWIPNPYPARHFVYIAPVLSAGIAIWLSKIAEGFILSRVSFTELTGAIGVFLIFLAPYMIVSKFDGITLYRNMYSQNKAYEIGRLSKDLLQLEPLDKPVFVVSMARPVLTNMQIKADSIVVDRKEYIFYYVKTDRNEFVFCKDGDNENQVKELQKRADKHGKTYWVIDPYNTDINNKPFNAHVPPSHIQLNFSEVES